MSGFAAVAPTRPPIPSSVAPPPRPRRLSPAAALRLPPLLQQCVGVVMLMVLLVLELRHITCNKSYCSTIVV